jgi:hypothetical protein
VINVIKFLQNSIQKGFIEWGTSVKAIIDVSVYMLNIEINIYKNAPFFFCKFSYIYDKSTLAILLPPNG